MDFKSISYRMSILSEKKNQEYYRRADKEYWKDTPNGMEEHVNKKDQ